MQTIPAALAVTPAEEEFFDKNYDLVNGIYGSAEVMDRIFSRTAEDQGLPDAPYTRIVTWMTQARQAAEAVLGAIGVSIIPLSDKKGVAKSRVGKMTSEEFRRMLQNENKLLDAAITKAQGLQRELRIDIELFGTDQYPALKVAQDQANELLRLLQNKKSEKDAFEKEHYSARKTPTDRRVVATVTPNERALRHLQRNISVLLSLSQSAYAPMLNETLSQFNNFIELFIANGDIAASAAAIMSNLQTIEDASMVATNASQEDFIKKVAAFIKNYIQHVWNELQRSRAAAGGTVVGGSHPGPSTPPPDKNEFEQPVVEK